MPLQLRYLIAAAFLTPLFAYAQPQELPPPMVFGTVPAELLKMTQFDADTSATAVVLCNYGKAEIETPPGSIRLRWEHHKRIKILKKTGFDYANIKIPFYSHNKIEEFFFDKGEIHLPNGQRIKLTKKDIFIEKLNDHVSVARFTFPQLEEGCVIEYSYFINSKTVHELRPWYFQEDIPTLWSEVRANYPTYLEYVYSFQGIENMVKTEEPNGTVRYQGKYGAFLFTPGRFVMQNAPALREEAFVTTMSDYLASIQFQLSEIRHPDGRIEKVMTTWKELQEDLQFSSSFGEQFLKKGNFKKISEAILPQVSTLPDNKTKARFIYDHLTQNLSWNGAYSVFTRQKELNEIYAAKEASSGELNMMLFMLLREAGIKAYPVLTSTRSHGRVNERYPILDHFNHMMVLAVPDANPQLMDATDPMRAPGYPSVQALNNRGLMLNFETGEPTWMDIKPPTDGADILVFNFSLDEAGTVRGKILGAHKGYNAIPERRAFAENSAGEHWKKRLQESFPDVVVEAAKTGNLQLLDKTFYDTIEVEIPNVAQVAGDFMYISPVIYSEFKENVLKLKERTYPVDLPYPFVEQLVVRLTPPAGYHVESLPEKVSFALPDGGGIFTFAAESKSDGMIQFSSKLSLSKQRYLPDEYPALKEIFDILAAKLEEQVVLKKAG